MAIRRDEYTQDRSQGDAPKMNDFEFGGFQRDESTSYSDNVVPIRDEANKTPVSNDENSVPVKKTEDHSADAQKYLEQSTQATSTAQTAAKTTSASSATAAGSAVGAASATAAAVVVTSIVTVGAILANIQVKNASFLSTANEISYSFHLENASERHVAIQLENEDYEYVVSNDAHDGFNEGSFVDLWEDTTYQVTILAYPEEDESGEIVKEEEVLLRQQVRTKKSAEPTPSSDTDTSSEPDPVEPVKYSVTFDANGGSGTMQGLELEEGEEYLLPTCSFDPPYGSEFDSWKVGGVSKDPGEPITIEGDTEIIAVWRNIFAISPLIWDRKAQFDQGYFTVQLDYDDPSNVLYEFQLRLTQVDLSVEAEIPLELTKEAQTVWAKEFDPNLNFTAPMRYALEYRLQESDPFTIAEEGDVEFTTVDPYLDVYWDYTVELDTAATSVSLDYYDLNGEISEPLFFIVLSTEDQGDLEQGYDLKLTNEPQTIRLSERLAVPITEGMEASYYFSYTYKGETITSEKKEFKPIVADTTRSINGLGWDHFMNYGTGEFQVALDYIDTYDSIRSVQLELTTTDDSGVTGDSSASYSWNLEKTDQPQTLNFYDGYVFDSKFTPDRTYKAVVHYTAITGQTFDGLTIDDITISNNGERDWCVASFGLNSVVNYAAMTINTEGVILYTPNDPGDVIENYILTLYSGEGEDATPFEIDLNDPYTAEEISLTERAPTLTQEDLMAVRRYTLTAVLADTSEEVVVWDKPISFTA